MTSERPWGRRPSVRRAARALVVVALVAGVAGAAWWAGRVTMASAPDPGGTEPARVTAVAADATVGRSINLSVTVTQKTVPLASNTLPGVITDVAADLSATKVGDMLYEVAGVPVRAVEGRTPFYRDLGVGDRGRDVEQLQEALKAAGHLEAAVDGRFGMQTARAVRAWQRDLGAAESDTIRLGELVAIRTSPSQLTLGADIRLGMTLSGGEDAVLGYDGEPAFTLVLTEEQERMIPSGSPIQVDHDGDTWDATIASTQLGENGAVTALLTSPRGGAVCGDACAALPVVERLTLPSTIVLVPEVSGPAVPAAAVRTGNDGSRYVEASDGTRTAVTILGASGGVVVLEGIEVGAEVLISPGISN